MCYDADMNHLPWKLEVLRATSLAIANRGCEGVRKGVENESAEESTDILC